MVLDELFSKLGLTVDEKSFAKGILAADGLKAALGAIVGAAKAATVALRDMTFGVIDEADALAKLSSKVGVSAQALQELGYAGDLSDVSLETLAGGLKLLQKNMVEAAEGNDELRKTFRTLGVQVVDGSGKLRSTDEVFTELADKFSQMPATAARAAFAMKVFGKSGAELMPLLAEGAEGLGALRQEFRDLHGGFSDEFLDNAQQFNDDVSRIKTAWQGVKYQVAQAVLPALQDVAATALEWVKANKDLIRTKVKEYVEKTVDVIYAIARGIRDWVREQGGLEAVIDKAGKYLKAFGIILAAIKISEFVVGVGNMINALKTLGAVIKGGLGMAGLVGLIIWAASAIIENWDDIRAFGLEVFWALERIWMDLAAFFVQFGESLHEIFVQPWIDAGTEIKEFFTAIFDWIVEKVMWVANKTRDVLDYINPFDIDDTSTSGVRGVQPDGAGVSLGGLGGLENLRSPSVVAPTVTPLAAAGTSVSLVSSPQLNITTHPSQSNEEIARIAAAEIERNNRTLMREAAGGLG